MIGRRQVLHLLTAAIGTNLPIRDVRSVVAIGVISGQHMLKASSSHFDPSATSARSLSVVPPKPLPNVVRADTMLPPEPRGGHEATRISRRTWRCSSGVPARCPRTTGHGACDRLSPPGSESTSSHLVAAFRQSLTDAGYPEGRIAIEYRWANSQYDRLPNLAADLVRRNVSVIFAPGGPPQRIGG